MIPTLSQVCSLNSPFEQDVVDYAAGQCTSVEIWLPKLETFLQSHDIQTVQRLFAEHQVTPAVASFQGGLLASQGQPRRVAWDHFRQRLGLCRQIGVQTLVVACDISPPVDAEVIQRVGVSLIEVARAAAEHGLRVALEFQAKSAWGNNLQTALALVQQVGSPHLGVCLDAFHFYVGPSKLADLAEFTCDNLFHVQLCDLADVPREWARDSDRILPGDGDIPLEPMIGQLEAMHYTGCVSLELMNARIWQIPALQFGEIGMTALRKLLGQAAMDPPSH